MPSCRDAIGRKTLVILILGLAGTGPLIAQAPAPLPTCDAAEYRQLDFWVGNWDVTSHGQPAGKNLVTREEDGCLVHEHWTGAGGDTGQSFNFYDRGDQKWHQVWVSNSGNVLDLAGTYVDGTLTYYGRNRRPDGRMLEHRLSFHANPDGSVRQLWQTSADSGATWKESFDGLYRKRGG